MYRPPSEDSMSYKLDLSHLDRDGDVSITQQLADLFANAIEDGKLEPGEKLPTTRALAAEAGVNHLTAARVYRRLAELGYVTATVGRGTFVRTLVPAASEEQGDDWQVWALPDRPASYSEQVQDDAFSRALLEPGDVAVVESPTYTGLLTSLRATGARVIGVPYNRDGLDLDALEHVLARHEVKLCALQTVSQNPTGRDLLPERRERLAELAVDRNFFVLEDGVYSDVRFDGEQPPPLRELAPGHVIYCDSMSKTVGGGLRMGWIAARGPVFDRLAMLELNSDFHTNTLSQHITARFLAAGLYEKHLASSNPFYQERRDLMMEALERHLAGEYRAERPNGGHHVWVQLVRPVDERALYREAVRQGVTFTPGGTVTVERMPLTSLRLSFSLVDPEELDEGVRRLARALREVRRRERYSATVPVS